MSREKFNTIICGDSREEMKKLRDDSVHLIVTSPPYWNTIDYGYEGQIGQSSYEEYLQDLLEIWKESERVLIPNGKLCINTPIMPLTKKEYNESHTRHIKNLNNDIECTILKGTGFERYSLFVWQKQTSEKMFGSYPYPPNIYEDNTIEFINVFVKQGKPRKLDKAVKEKSKLTQKEWLDLTRQMWYLYPEDVSRTGGHPAPFPVLMPARLIKIYTFAESKELDFEGDVVLDMFCGTGATCVAAKKLGRRYIGIDKGENYCVIARQRLLQTYQDLEMSVLSKRIKFVEEDENQIAFGFGEEKEEKSSPKLVAFEKAMRKRRQLVEG